MQWSFTITADTPQQIADELKLAMQYCNAFPSMLKADVDTSIEISDAMRADRIE